MPYTLKPLGLYLLLVSLCNPYKLKPLESNKSLVSLCLPFISKRLGLYLY